MDIGGVELKGHVVLGPMAGVTSLAYRRFYKPFGVALSVSEMISDCGLAYGNARTLDYLATSEDDRPVALQIFGSHIEDTRKAIAIMEEKADYDILDVNLGCPVHKVTKTGAGSALLGHPEKLYEYMKEIVEASHKPVTAKIRLGIDRSHINALEVSDLLVTAGVKGIAIHCRTKADLYAGTADYEAIRDLGRKLPVPLIVSGDINSVENAIRAMDITGAELVMVARGGIGNPALITQIEAAIQNKEIPANPTLNDQISYALTFSHMLVEEKGERTAVMLLRGILPHFFKGQPGFKRIRHDISTNISTIGDVEILLGSIQNKLSI